VTVSPGSLTERISVVVIDDHQAFSDALGLALDLEADLSYVGAATTFESGFELVSKLHPSVVLMDHVLPDGDGVWATSRIRDSFPHTRVVLITDQANARLIEAAAEAGAAAFVAKQSPIVDVIRALRHADDGAMMVDHNTLKLVMQDRNSPDRDPANTHGLNERDLVVLDLLGQGLPLRSIAADLCVSINTARGYTKSILSKLGVHSQREAVIAGLRLGLIAVPAASPLMPRV
jgi:DNA-binding NarL/FixJ family response regulator